MISRDDFDAYRYPELRRQLMAGADALHDSVQKTRDRSQLDARLRSLEPRDCPLCGNSRNSAELIVTKHDVDVVRCRECGMVYTSSVSRSDLFTFTNPSSSASFVEHQDAFAYRSLARKKYEYYLQEAERFIAPGALLEIGCCAGEFMDVARGRQWQPSGIDASEHFTSLASQKGFATRTGVFPDTVSLAPQEHYDMIVLLDVVEHFPDPVSALRLLKPHLRDGGLLMIQVPNFHSPLVALQGAASRNYALSHWSHFTGATLAATSEAAGYRTLKMQTVITELDLILRFPREAVDRSIRSVVGEDVAIPEVLEPEWLHEHLLGYKLFGLFSPSPYATLTS